MKIGDFTGLIGLIIFLIIAIMFITIYFFNTKHDPSENAASGDSNDADNGIYWRADSAVWRHGRSYDFGI